MTRPPATWTVTYTPRNGTETKTATVRVSMDATTARFTATELALWGCGKSAMSPIGAIRNLVQDMATIHTMVPNIPQT